MKFLIIFVLAFATASASDLRNAEVKQHSAVVTPVKKTQGFFDNIAEFESVKDSAPVALETKKLVANNSVPAHLDIDDRITNGIQAYRGQLPYQAGLFLRKAGYNSFCGGSLIGRNWVLSAAHCMGGVQYITVYLGSILRNYGEQSYTVSRQNLIIHHGWNSQTFRNDICLIKIPTVTYNKYVQPIKIPSFSSASKLYTGYNGIHSGWGQNGDNSPLTKYLLWGRSRIISNDVCRIYFGNYVTHTNICISTLNSYSSCFGDSGGPLVVEGDNIQVGISALLVSRRCTAGYPASFTRVSKYLDWIKYYTGIYYP